MDMKNDTFRGNSCPSQRIPQGRLWGGFWEGLGKVLGWFGEIFRCFFNRFSFSWGIFGNPREGGSGSIRETQRILANPGNPSESWRILGILANPSESQESWRILSNPRNPSELQESQRILPNPRNHNEFWRILSNPSESYRILANPSESQRILANPSEPQRILAKPREAARIVTNPI